MKKVMSKLVPLEAFEYHFTPKVLIADILGIFGLYLACIFYSKWRKYFMLRGTLGVGRRAWRVVAKKQRAGFPKCTIRRLAPVGSVYSL